MNAINVFEGKLNRVKEEYDLVCRAKEALDLELTRHTRLEPVFEELRDLKAVWTALSGIWSQINELREIAWATVQPRKLRQQIDSLLSSTKDMPTRMRQYAAFEYVQDVLKGLLKSNTIVSELKSEALKERHWKQLFKVLRLPSQISLPLCVHFLVFWNAISNLTQDDAWACIRHGSQEERELDQGCHHPGARRGRSVFF